MLVNLNLAQGHVLVPISNTVRFFQSVVYVTAACDAGVISFND